MSAEAFGANARTLFIKMLEDAPAADQRQVIEVYAELLTRLHAVEAHSLLNQVIADAKLRLDARLSPDPVRQGIASVQSTVQDVWNPFWRE